jgi:DNA-binding HxlR family transcriptional regulator
MKTPRTPGRARGGLRRSPCPIANTLDLVGDKWTLLVVRDLLFFGKRRYQELAASPEGIPSNILADRLKRLGRAGLIEKAPYQQRPVRYAYALTDRGADLRPALLALIRWGNRHIPGTCRPTPAQARTARRSTRLPP